MKIVEIFGENRLEFIEKCKIIEIWWMISIAQVKLSKMPAKRCVFAPKMKRILKIFKKILRFFDQNLYGKLTFFTIFPKYVLDFWLRSESIDLWKIRPDFYNNFSDFVGGGTFRRPPRCYCPLAKNKSPKCNGPFHLKVFYKLWQHGFRLVPHDFFYWS